MATTISAGSLRSLEKEFDNLRRYANARAVNAHFIRPEDIAWLIQSYTPNTLRSAGILEADAKDMAERTQDPDQLQGVLNLTRMMAIDRIILNALSSAYRASVTPEPEQQFRGFFEKGLTDPEKRKDFIKALKAAREQMIISIVQTMHPTIYHTKFAREMEIRLTDEMEALVADIVNNQPGQTNPALRNALRDAVKETIKELIRRVNDGEKLTYDRPVTLSEENRLDHNSHVAMKNNFKEVLEAYNRTLTEVVDSLESSGDMNHEQADTVRGYTIDPQTRDPFQWRTWAFGADADGRPKSTAPVLWQYIYYQVENGQYISRLRDARDNADDHIDAVSCLVQRAFLIDKKRKERPDGEQVADLLVAAQEADSEGFVRFCRKFAEELKEPLSKDKPWLNPGERHGWENPEHSLLQQLAPSEQTEFLRRIVAGEYGNEAGALRKDFRFLPPALREETIKFNEMFVDKYKEFLGTNRERLSTELGIEIETIQGPNGDGEKLLLPEVDALKLPDGNPSHLLEELREFIKQQPVQIDVEIDGEIHRETVYFDLDPNDLISERLEPEDKDLHVKSRLFKDARILQAGETPGGYSTQVLLHPTRSKLLEVIKRAYVLNDANQKFGGKVCNREQISEFSGPQDFYAAMLLFKEAGIININNQGLVEGAPSICIQPLFETSEDQEHAAETFATLLDDPMVRSYYKELAKAGVMPQVMFGCSDGAKSAGNLSSEWSNYIYTRKIQGVFQDACVQYPDLEGINLRLRVFYGRGHGDSRGGHMAEGQNQRMMSPEMAEDMIYDVTIQSDEHMQMMMSKPFGLDTCASILEGTVTAKCEAEQEKEKRKAATYRDKIKGMEDVISKMANESKEGYRKYVSRRPETMIFIDSIHDNPYKSSRPAKRTGDAAEINDMDAFEARKGISAEEAMDKLDNTRAITVEYAFQAMADFPIHYMGMRTALNHHGLNELQYLYQNHPFFRNMVDKTKVALKDYDPDVFRQYAKIAGVSDWAEECIAEFNGHGGNEKNLIQLLDSISHDTSALETGEAIREIISARANDPQAAGYGVRSRNLLRGPATMLDKLAHIIPFSFAVDLNTEPPEIKSRWQLGINPLKPSRTKEEDRLKVEILDNCSFTAQEIHPQNLKFPSERVLADVDMAR